jgi:hypothetical protein
LDVVGSATCWEVPALVMKEVVLFSWPDIDRTELDGVEMTLLEMLLIEVK